MALGSVATGEQRAWFLAVGLNDNTVRVISLDPSVSFQITAFINSQSILNDEPRTPLNLCD